VLEFSADLLNLGKLIPDHLAIDFFVEVCGLEDIEKVESFVKHHSMFSV